MEFTNICVKVKILFVPMKNGNKELTKIFILNKNLILFAEFRTKRLPFKIQFKD
jgi:hypothetical protein